MLDGLDETLGIACPVVRCLHGSGAALAHLARRAWIVEKASEDAGEIRGASGPKRDAGAGLTQDTHHGRGISGQYWQADRHVIEELVGERRMEGYAPVEWQYPHVSRAPVQRQLIVREPAGEAHPALHTGSLRLVLESRSRRTVTDDQHRDVVGESSQSSQGDV